jgi:hypothetical protein
MPAWLVVAALAVTGYVVARFLPLGDALAIAVLGLGGVASGVAFMRRSRANKESSSLTAVLIFIGFAGYMGGIAFGRDASLHGRVPLDPAGLLILGLGAVLAGYAFWCHRPWRSRAAPGGGKMAPRGVHSNLAGATSGNVAQPWRVAGWMVVGLLVCLVVLPCFIGIWVLVPAYQATEARKFMEAQMAVVSVSFDEQTPVVELNHSPVFSNPEELRQPPGRWVVEVTYLRAGQRYTFEHVIEVKAREQKTLDLAPIIREDIAARKSD